MVQYSMLAKEVATGLGKKVIDTDTGIEYPSLRDYCIKFNLEYYTVRRHLKKMNKVNKYKNLIYKL